MKYKVNNEGIEALRQLSHTMKSCVHLLNSASTLLSLETGRNPDGAGPHYEEIADLTGRIRKTAESIADPVVDLTQRLDNLAEAYEELINDGLDSDTQASGGFSGAQTAAANGSSFADSGLNGISSDGTTGVFSGLECAQMQNGEYAVKGNNFDQFYEEFYDDNSESVRPDPQNAVEIADAADIEGITLTARDLTNPDVFWQMHGYPKENYLEIASHIPEVQQKLDMGMSLDEIRNDPSLRVCATQYFDPYYMPTVEKCGSYYTLTGGRHRAIAAKILGLHMPVRIVSIRSWDQPVKVKILRR